MLSHFITHDTHTHPFNSPFSGTTRVSRYQKGETNLDFTEAWDSDWQWDQLGHMQVCISLQTDIHASTPPLSFFTGRMPCYAQTLCTIIINWVLIQIETQTSLKLPSKMPIYAEKACDVCTLLRYAECAAMCEMCGNPCSEQPLARVWRAVRVIRGKVASQANFYRDLPSTPSDNLWKIIY